jgi:hypothetical protein
MEWGGKSMRAESDPCLANAPTEARQENSILIKSPRDAQLEEPSIRRMRSFAMARRVWALSI